MKKYCAPNAELLLLRSLDVITTSWIEGDYSEDENAFYYGDLNTGFSQQY